MEKYFTSEYDARMGGEFVRIYDENGHFIRNKRGNAPEGLTEAYRRGSIIDLLHDGDGRTRVVIGELAIYSGEMTEEGREFLHSASATLRDQNFKK